MATSNLDGNSFMPDDSAKPSNKSANDKDTAAIIAELLRESPYKSSEQLAYAGEEGGSDTSLLGQFLTRGSRKQAQRGEARPATNNTNNNNVDTNVDTDDSGSESVYESNARITEAAKNRQNRRLPRAETPPPAAEAPPVPRDDRTRSSLTYGDPNFDQKLANCKTDILILNGLPSKVGLKPHVDKDGYYFTFENGTKTGPDGHIHHYWPNSLRFMECQGVQMELKVWASENKHESLLGNTQIGKWLRGLTEVAGDIRENQKEAYLEGMKEEPNNPYYPLFLSELMIAEALDLNTVRENTEPGEKLSYKNPGTAQRLKEAKEYAERAVQICNGKGYRIPTDNQHPARPLYPNGLAPHTYNPDMYWGGALDQAFHRLTVIQSIKYNIQKGVIKIDVP